MDERRIAELAFGQGGVISSAQLQACGLSRSGIAGRVSNSRLFPVLRSVYGLGPVIDAWGRRWAAVLATDAERAVLSHWSAGEVHRMCGARGRRVHVTVPGGGRPGAAGLVAHRSRNPSPEDVVVIRGLRVTSPERTVIDIAGFETDAGVERIIREGEFHGVLRSGALRDAVAGRHGHRGLARVRRVDPATIESALPQTPLEDDLEPLLVALGLPNLARQQWVRGFSGAHYRVDFAYPGARLAIEADGRAAHERALGFEKDRAREADLGPVGWQTLRFTRIQVHRAPETVRTSVLETVRVRSRLNH